MMWYLWDLSSLVELLIQGLCRCFACNLTGNWASINPVFMPRIQRLFIGRQRRGYFFCRIAAARLLHIPGESVSGYIGYQYTYTCIWRIVAALPSNLIFFTLIGWLLAEGQLEPKLHSGGWYRYILWSLAYKLSLAIEHASTFGQLSISDVTSLYVIYICV